MSLVEQYLNHHRQKPQMQKWWDSYFEAKTHFETHRNWDLTGKAKLSKWATTVRKSWNDEKLDAVRIHALREISFPRTVAPGAKRSPTRPDVERLLELRAKLKDGSATDEERLEAKKCESTLCGLYRSGYLPNIHAAKLGF